MAQNGRDDKFKEITMEKIFNKNLNGRKVSLQNWEFNSFMQKKKKKKLETC